MSIVDYLIWPWEDWRGSVEGFREAVRIQLEHIGLNYIKLNLDSRKFEEYKKGEMFGPKCEQSLEYMILNWPKDHPRRIAVQAGGCLGLWPKVLSHYFDTVYTFEAQSEAFYFLSLNCPERNIIKLQAALGAKGGEFIDIPMTNKPGHGKVVSSKVGIPVLALDSLNLPHCDALMLDVEGYEPEVLRGAMNLIKTHRPYVLCEDNWNSAEIEAILSQYGYEFITKANKDKIFKHKSKSWPGGPWDKHTKGVKK